MKAETRELFGEGRFELLRHLGSGGMGAVYEAFDRERGARVALKTVELSDPTALLHLKSEFRAVRDVRHENLVDLIELCENGGRWCFTMELLDGVDFLSHVRGSPFPLVLSGFSETSMIAHEESLPAPESNARARECVPALDVARLRGALGQLVRGLNALHGAGKIHRDVKPTNVLVTRSGRVVLLDFGLATGLGDATRSRAGTRAFMAPEQAAGEPITAAADWYAVGVVLHLALTGAFPFSGGSAARDRAHGKRRRVRELNPDAPEDLASLCETLLEVDPASRPSGPEISSSLEIESKLAARTRTPFVGRVRELCVLEAAFDESASHSVTTLIVGESGVGKTALVHHFVRTITAARPNLLALFGRCYERELVPYKAFDGIVDQLSQWLIRLEPEKRKRLLPEHGDALARAFPVLRVVLGKASSEPEGAPTQELRNQAFSALRTLLSNVASERPLLLCIDDLQWADADSWRLLAELLGPQRARPFCVIATARSPSPLVNDPTVAAVLRSGDVRRFELSPLSQDEARTLVSELLGDQATPTLVEGIAAETWGHPLFALALSDDVRRAPGEMRAALKLDDALLARIERCDERSRTLLEHIAVAGVPLGEPVLSLSTGLSPAACAASTSALSSARLLRSGSGEAKNTVEAYHDRIREVVLAGLDPSARRECHVRLARALLETGHAERDPQVLVRHLEGAGNPERAAELAELAADRASAALAFDQAAELYRTARRLGRRSDAAQRDLTARLAEALTNAGRGAEAAEAYLECAEGAPEDERLDYRRHAADRLLRSGHLDAGMTVLGQVLAEIGERFPRSQTEAVLLGATLRARTRWRGLRYQPRNEAEVQPDRLLELDVYHTVSAALSLVDMLRANVFQTRSLALALDTGEPRRLAKTLVLEAIYVASTSRRGLARGRALLAEARRIATEHRDRYLNAACLMSEGFLDYHGGAYRCAQHKYELAAAGFREEPGAYHEQSVSSSFALVMLRMRGAIGELRHRFFESLRDAEHRGDRFTETGLKLHLNVVWLANDDTAEATRHLDHTDWTPPEGHYHTQLWYQAQARAELALYTGDAADGLVGFRRFLAAVGRRFVFHVRVHRVLAQWLEARLLVASANGGKRATAEAARLAARFGSGGVRYARPYELLIRAAVAAQRHERATAVRLLEDAVRCSERADLPHCAAAARFRLGTLIGGARGTTLLGDARAWMQSQGLARPDRMLEVWAPGFG